MTYKPFISAGSTSVVTSEPTLRASTPYKSTAQREAQAKANAAKGNILPEALCHGVQEGPALRGLSLRVRAEHSLLLSLFGGEGTLGLCSKLFLVSGAVAASAARASNGEMGEVGVKSKVKLVVIVNYGNDDDRQTDRPPANE